jgi:phosphoribosyl 1,2-cyclic phosphate phosphodiesterase
VGELGDRAVLQQPQGTIQSTLLPHGGLNTLGLIFTERSSGKKFAYYTDCKRVPREAVELARGSDAVVLDGLRSNPHPSHMSIEEAIVVGQEIAARATWVTHLTHLNDHAALASRLPATIQPAYDGLRLKM